MALTVRDNNGLYKEIDKLKKQLNKKSAQKIIEYTVFGFSKLKDEIKQLNSEIQELNKIKTMVKKELSDTYLAISRKLNAEELLQEANKELNAIIFCPGESRSDSVPKKNDCKISAAGEL